MAGNTDGFSRVRREIDKFSAHCAENYRVHRQVMRHATGGFVAFLERSADATERALTEEIARRKVKSLIKRSTREQSNEDDQRVELQGVEGGAAHFCGPQHFSIGATSVLHH
jgi:hypothetical protein